jgi:hypothetical protein
MLLFKRSLSQSQIWRLENINKRNAEMSTTNKCAHPACSCVVPEGKHYCSESCERAKGLTELTCQCQNPECRGEQLK